MGTINLITQAAAAEKYGIDEGTISVAISAAGLSPMTVTGNKKQKRLYDEGSLVEAMVKLFRVRRNRSMYDADGWAQRIEETMKIYGEE